MSRTSLSVSPSPRKTKRKRRNNAASDYERKTPRECQRCKRTFSAAIVVKGENRESDFARIRSAGAKGSLTGDSACCYAISRPATLPFNSQSDAGSWLHRADAHPARGCSGGASRTRCHRDRANRNGKNGCIRLADPYQADVRQCRSEERRVGKECKCRV